jgi:hypothetical protein
MSQPSRFHRNCQFLLAGVLSFPLLASAQTVSSADVVYEFRSVVPLGVETFELHPERQTINLLASAESQLFQGVRLLGHGRNRIVLAADGTELQRFPQRITFRVTASARGKALDDKPVPIDTSTDLNQYLLSLHFRLKIFRGLEYREVEPARAELVGVPADVSYDERIYRLEFELNNVGVDERMLLEVYDAGRDRLTRFHLELM